METFGQAWDRITGGQSLRHVAERAGINPGHLSRMVNGKRPLTKEAAADLDRALGTGGTFASLVSDTHTRRAGRQPQIQPWETAELVQRLQASAVTSATVETLHSTVFELCCEYPYREAIDLRREAHDWLREVNRLLRLPVGLAAHRELLTAGGWLALLAGCLEYDMGYRAGAEASRVAAQQLGVEGGNAEVVGWSYEMSAWFALTQARLRNVLSQAKAGQHAAPSRSAAVQLTGQEAKAYARMGDVHAVRDALERGKAMLDAMPYPERPDHHFVVDPDKWDFYAMDAYRQVGDDELAEHHANAVLELGTQPDGGEKAPMRMAEARLTLAAVAARRGDLEQAVATAIGALGGRRKSLPQLLMVGAELDDELRRRYPGEAGAADFHEALRTVKADGR